MAFRNVFRLYISIRYRVGMMDVSSNFDIVYHDTMTDSLKDTQFPYPLTWSSIDLNIKPLNIVVRVCYITWFKHILF